MRAIRAEPHLTRTEAQFMAYWACVGVALYAQGSPGNCACSIATQGPCTIWTCTLGSFVPPGGLDRPTQADVPGQNVDDGTISISGGVGPTIVMQSAANGYSPFSEPTSRWQPGDKVTISSSGANAPPFSAEVVFPAPIVLTQPDLSLGPLTLGATVDLTWTGGGDGEIEVLVSDLFRPDARTSSVTTRCTAPIATGTLTVPIPNASMEAGFRTRGLQIRAQSTVTQYIDDWEITTAAVSFDSGPIPWVSSP